MSISDSMSGKRAKGSSHGFSLRGFVRQSAHTQNWHFMLFVCVPFKTERTSSSPLELFTSPNSSPKTSKRRCETVVTLSTAPPEMRLIDCIEHKDSNLLLNHQSLTCCAGRCKTAVAIALWGAPFADFENGLPINLVLTAQCRRKVASFSW